MSIQFLAIFSEYTTVSSTTWNNTKYYTHDDNFHVPFMTLKSAALGGLVVWTVIANALVFVVLYKNPRLQTVPNFLVGNLAFSDLCLGLVVLPLAAVYAITLRWSFGQIVCEIWLSSDVLCSTASIWNLSIIGLDRYWAITSPIKYMTKRTMRSAVIMIGGVWVLSMIISVAPFLGWRNASEKGNYYFENQTSNYQCGFLDLPSYSIYSATGSFFIPLTVMFFVYFQIYRAFAEHKARHMYRQKVLRKHIESTILHEISHVLPLPLAHSDEYKDDEEEDDDEDDEDDSEMSYKEEEEEESEKGKVNGSNVKSILAAPSESVYLSNGPKSVTVVENGERVLIRNTSNRRSLVHKKTPHLRETGRSYTTINLNDLSKNKRTTFAPEFTPTNQIKHPLINKSKNQKKRDDIKKPAAISAAKEKRGVKVLGIILGCFTVCWTPFFIMYSITGLCQRCRPNPHIEQFITWLGYSNSAMNPIIYTVFNRDYQIALKRLFTRNTNIGGVAKKRKPQAV